MFFMKIVSTDPNKSRYRVVTGSPTTLY
ncbi:plasmid stabilization protein, partial [Salmonella enterica subsp. enterica serovar Stanley]|nr:plasmid stabilization protein [Salmonella enterica subsp. enterica serovar Stanley]